MNIRRIVPNIQSDRVDESRKFYTEFLGLEVAMDMVDRDAHIAEQSDGPIFNFARASVSSTRGSFTISRGCGR
jgi:catechol 2,3-dioxygenase-like lactoylglutathione lyase family enzyme